MPRSRVPSNTAPTLAEWLLALGNPTRLRLLAALAAGPKTARELVEECGPTCYQAVGYMRVIPVAGLVAVEP